MTSFMRIKPVSFGMSVSLLALMTSGALAFESTGIEKLDDYLTAYEKSGFTVKSYGEVSESADTITIHDLKMEQSFATDTAELDEFGTNEITIELQNISGIKNLDNGLVSVGTVEANGYKIQNNFFELTADKSIFKNTVVGFNPNPQSFEEALEVLNYTPNSSTTVSGMLIKGVDKDAQFEVTVAQANAAMSALDDNGDLTFTSDFKNAVLDTSTLNKQVQEAFANLDLDGITLNLDIRGKYNPESGDLAFEEYSMDAQDLGKIDFSLTMGGLTMASLEKLAELEDEDNDADAMSLAQMFTISDVSIDYVDYGLFDRALSVYAQKQGSTPEAIKAALQMMLPLSLESVPDKALKQQLLTAGTAFLKDPVSLSASASVANPMPFPQVAGSVMMAPTQISKLFNVKVEANTLQAD
ncbi:hypothetical protein [Flexibacterium corallicola]|uniref:hypothetical protein n=1 Tax=Flexibacterium corallicola TaxID=3037259 RepID=UPI00286EF3B8|nr:hypothetical protein [Pseudovibrio sp. M1P-2-3]